MLEISEYIFTKKKKIYSTEYTFSVYMCST